MPSHSFVVVHSIFLLPTVKIESSLVLPYLIGGDIPLMAHGPDGRQDNDVGKDIRTLGELLMLVFHMLVYLCDDCLNKLWCIRLVQRLVQIHDVAHHLCMKSYGVQHAILKGQVFIMKEVFISLSIVITEGLSGVVVASSGLSRHVMHT